MFRRKNDIRGVGNLEGQEKEECLNTVEASVHKVPHEKVVGVWHISSNLAANNRIFWTPRIFQSSPKSYIYFGMQGFLHGSP